MCRSQGVEHFPVAQPADGYFSKHCCAANKSAHTDLRTKSLQNNWKQENQRSPEKYLICFHFFVSLDACSTIGMANLTQRRAIHPEMFADSKRRIPALLRAAWNHNSLVICGLATRLTELNTMPHLSRLPFADSKHQPFTTRVF